MRDKQLDIIFREFKAWKQRKGRQYEFAQIIFYEDRSGTVYKSRQAVLDFEEEFHFSSVSHLIHLLQQE